MFPAPQCSVQPKSLGIVAFMEKLARCQVQRLGDDFFLRQRGLIKCLADRRPIDAALPGQFSNTGAPKAQLVNNPGSPAVRFSRYVCCYAHGGN